MRYVFALATYISLPVVVFAATEIGGPGVISPTALPNSPGIIISQIFNFALAFSGILAFVMIVWGGVKYAANPGNSSALGDAKDQIIQALLGLLLLVGSFLFLNTINPQITLSGFAKLTSIPSGNTPSSCNPACPAGQFCIPAENPSSPGVCQGCSVKCGGNQVCKLMPGFNTPLCVTCDYETQKSCKSNEKCVASGNSFKCIGNCNDGYPNGYCEGENEVCDLNQGKPECVKNPT